MKRIAIVVAGGKGLRMGADIPKQFLEIGNKKRQTILMWTLENISKSVDDIILVLPKDYRLYWDNLIEKYTFGIGHIVVDGGETRYHSVLSALKSIECDDAILLIHDAVRPFIDTTLIDNLVENAEKNTAAIPYIEMTDSIRHIDKDGNSVSIDRKDYIRIQTPQVFLASRIKEAYSVGYRDDFTDDASVFEYKFPNKSISLVKSDEKNIKITKQIDLALADILIKAYE